jgi:hypothetical protein
MGLRADAVKLAPAAAEALDALSSSDSKEAKSILRRVEACKGILLLDMTHGEVVKKDRIPDALKAKHDIKNLYVEDLPAFWRLLYTLTRDGPKRVVTVVEIVDHPTYDKWFPGRGR